MGKNKLKSTSVGDLKRYVQYYKYVKNEVAEICYMAVNELFRIDQENEVVKECTNRLELLIDKNKDIMAKNQ